MLEIIYAYTYSFINDDHQFLLFIFSFILYLNTALTAAIEQSTSANNNLYSLVNPFSAIYFLCALFLCEGSCAPSNPTSDNL